MYAIADECHLKILSSNEIWTILIARPPQTVIGPTKIALPKNTTDTEDRTDCDRVRLVLSAYQWVKQQHRHWPSKELAAAFD